MPPDKHKDSGQEHDTITGTLCLRVLHWDKVEDNNCATMVNGARKMVEHIGCAGYSRAE